MILSLLEKLFSMKDFLPKFFLKRTKKEKILMRIFENFLISLIAFYQPTKNQTTNRKYCFCVLKVALADKA
jgi:hypothetical protein